jgi:hypothetical protein
MVDALQEIVGRKVLGVRRLNSNELFFDDAVGGVLIEMTRGQAVVICTLNTGEKVVRWQHPAGYVSILDQVVEAYSS